MIILIRAWLGITFVDYLRSEYEYVVYEPLRRSLVRRPATSQWPHVKARDQKRNAQVFEINSRLRAGVPLLTMYGI